MQQKTEKFQEFLMLYTNIQKKVIVHKDFKKDIEGLKDKVKELAESKALNLSDFNFDSDDAFLTSVKNYVNELLKNS